uniref:Transmembrane domain-containing protein n=1 Tax=Spironucleus salmonicida TaxID=348837 RepID=V6LUM7_9EUKA|eukprot:EST47963.1 Transmembrane domain-containing protein [Spironucleus salmonicida]
MFIQKQNTYTFQRNIFKYVLYYTLKIINCSFLSRKFQQLFRIMINILISLFISNLLTIRKKLYVHTQLYYQNGQMQFTVYLLLFNIQTQSLLSIIRFKIDKILLLSYLPHLEQYDLTLSNNHISQYQKIVEIRVGKQIKQQVTHINIMNQQSPISKPSNTFFYESVVIITMTSFFQLNQTEPYFQCALLTTICKYNYLYQYNLKFVFNNQVLILQMNIIVFQKLKSIRSFTASLIQYFEDLFSENSRHVDMRR